MKLLLIFLSLLISYPSFANCTADASFKEFVIGTKLFKSDNPQLALQQYAKQKGLSPDCAYSKAKNLIPDLAIKWKQEAEDNGCFDTPPGKACSDEMRSEIFGNITILEQWHLWTKANDVAPSSTLCLEGLGIAPEAEDLSSNLGEILSVANKMRRLENQLEIEKVDCDESTIALADSSSNFQYFQNLLKKGEEVSLDELLVLWYPEEKEFEEDPYFYNCQSNPWGPLDSTVKVEALNYLEQGCKPDVLYSWGSEAKLETIKSNLSNDSEWRQSPNQRENSEIQDIFMAMSPATTYGYGSVVVRFKVKKETPFPVGASHVFDYEDKRELTGVRVRQDVFQDFTINKSSFLESYSFGTAQIYDEIVRDVLRYKNKKRAQRYSGVSRSEDGWSFVSIDANDGLDNLFTFRPDGKDQSEEVLKRRLLAHIKMVLNGEGRVVFQKGVCQNQGKHYETDKPTYFNPR